MIYHFKQLGLWFVFASVLCINTANSEETMKRDIQPDTWVATDALGRTLPTSEEVGLPRENRTVAMFYFLWLNAHSTSGPWDITKILAQDPDAIQKPESPLWGPKLHFHTWAEPLFGYYTSTDEWVFRKHAQMLADAGVDAVIFDVTNQSIYIEQYRALCKAFTEARADGSATPQIAFLCPFGDPSRVVRNLYNDLYGTGDFEDLWFRWQGKPLIMADPDMVDEELRDFFTFRKPEPGYFHKDDHPDRWGWLDVYPQHIYKNSAGEVEQMTVGVAQNSQQAKRLSSFTEPNTTGRSWHNGAEDKTPGAVRYGLNFAEQWKYALEVDPQCLFITGWNEWIAMRLNDFGSVQDPVMFVDQFDQEHSRDIEPMNGGHGDNYYWQLIQNVRRYKGVRPIPTSNGPKTINIQGDFSQWKDVEPEYLDDIGDVQHRNSPGWGEVGNYINDSGRNDFVSSKITYDDENIYVYVKTKDPISPHTDPAWMMLLIEADGNDQNGWWGFDFIVNYHVIDETNSELQYSIGGWDWREMPGGKVLITRQVKGNEMQFSIPRKALGLIDGPPKFDFKWLDNTAGSGDMMQVFTHGDTAPNARYRYRFIGK